MIERNVAGAGIPRGYDPAADIRRPEYGCWKAMRARCRAAHGRAFKDYAGRGIVVCAEWDDFRAFLAAMGPRPSPAHSIDRIDVNGNYEPGNARWATRSEQQRNRRDSVFVGEGDARRNVMDVADDRSIRRDTVRSRIRRGKSPEESLRVGR